MIETELKRHQQSVSTRSPCCVTWNADEQDDGVIADFDFDDSDIVFLHALCVIITLILPLFIAMSPMVLSRGPPKQRERCDHMLRILPFSPPAPSNPPLLLPSAGVLSLCRPLPTHRQLPKLLRWEPSQKSAGQHIRHW